MVSNKVIWILAIASVLLLGISLVISMSTPSPVYNAKDTASSGGTQEAQVGLTIVKSGNISSGVQTG